MSKERKTVILVLMLIGITLLFTGSTFAYLMDSESVSNKITVGENKVELQEEFTPPEVLAPGVSFTKKAWAVNNGNTNSYVRAKIMFSVSDMKDNCENLVIGSNWTYNASDDFYYYTLKLKPGEKTTNLIESVKVKDSVNQSDLSEFEITIYLESITNETATNYASAWN